MNQKTIVLNPAPATEADIGYILDLLDEQKAEIERLKAQIGEPKWSGHYG